MGSKGLLSGCYDFMLMVNVGSLVLMTSYDMFVA